MKKIKIYKMNRKLIARIPRINFGIMIMNNKLSKKRKLFVKLKV